MRRDVRRAILLAAIAAEVKIKTTLAGKTPGEKRPLVDIILGSFREVEVAVAELPHKTIKAARSADHFTRTTRSYSRRSRDSSRTATTSLTVANPQASRRLGRT